MADGGRTLTRLSGKSALGIATFGAAAALWSLSLPLGCAVRAAEVGGFALLEGAALGAALASVTRTLRPGRIYFRLALAVLALVPFAYGWPGMDAEDLHPRFAAPEIADFYPDALRIFALLFGFPYPFATLGHFAPDPIIKKDEG